jgi:sialate O-acetylesterase
MARIPSLPFACFLVISATCLHAEVKLHPLFSDSMVLQRDMKVPIWGTATAGEKVTVEFGGQKAEATADDQGRWRVELAPFKAAVEAGDLIARATNMVTVRNVVVGDVWLAGGQSNMDSPLSSGSAAQALPEATNSLIRFFTVKKSISAEPLPEPIGKWELSTPEAAKGFSAVAYFFAREIYQSQKVPVGILRSSWGGTPIRTWMSLPSIQKEPPISSTLAEWESALAKHNEVKSQPQLQENYYKDMKDWETNVEPAFKAAKKAHPQEVAKAKAAGLPPPPNPQPSRPEPQAPDPIAMPSASKRPQTPTISYNAMIAPLVPYALKGFLWYQGEADVSKAQEYRTWFPRLIEGWRADWRQGDLPFLFVELPGNGKDTEPMPTKGIPFMREAQASVLALPATGMAVTADIGDEADVHPDNKIFTGTRLAAVAREKVYGEKMIGTGPRYRSHEIQGDKVRLQFDGIGGGLIIAAPPWKPTNAPAARTDRLVGFKIGDGSSWHDAEAVIDGETVVVSSPAVHQPTAVRYGWAATPVMNLYNREGFPAAPFRTDAP